MKKKRCSAIWYAKRPGVRGGEMCAYYLYGFVIFVRRSRIFRARRLEKSLAEWIYLQQSNNNLYGMTEQYNCADCSCCGCMIAIGDFMRLKMSVVLLRSHRIHFTDPRFAVCFCVCVKIFTVFFSLLSRRNFFAFSIFFSFSLKFKWVMSCLSFSADNWVRKIFFFWVAGVSLAIAFSFLVLIFTNW